MEEGGRAITGDFEWMEVKKKKEKVRSYPGSNRGCRKLMIKSESKSGVLTTRPYDHRLRRRYVALWRLHHKGRGPYPCQTIYIYRMTGYGAAP